ncbi:MarR family transcriptional regulator [Enterococcus sp. ALS3]|uniref:MarR family transcriptional regulator n=1 Tax=Enterococcus alishanensis TaxID=1303817 RepID=A0ABS6TGN9_9ENTE|nr:MarR family transcriptional regulator [Enterococcus alishanensis]MBV7391974.1 MarR family transcriptional regulator [Enterococcus alishanensis]
MNTELLQQFNHLMTAYKELEKTQHVISDLNLAEIHTIVLIGKQPEINVNNLALLREISRSAASQLTKKLETKGFLQRKTTEKNNKAVRLSLTPKGEEIYATHQAQQHYLEEKLNDVFKQYSEEQLQVIIDFMKNVEKVWTELPWINEGKVNGK